MRRRIRDLLCQRAYASWKNAYWYYIHYPTKSLGRAKGELYELIGDVWMTIAAAFDGNDYARDK